MSTSSQKVSQTVVNVKLTGGLIGLISSPRARLQNEIIKLNKKGYEATFVVQTTASPIFYLFSLLCLIITLTIWQPLPGYTILATTKA